VVASIRTIASKHRTKPVLLTLPATLFTSGYSTSNLLEVLAILSASLSAALLSAFLSTLLSALVSRWEWADRSELYTAPHVLALGGNARSLFL
jgi:hypothetical protein